jgi:hypothetical protein
MAQAARKSPDPIESAEQALRRQQWDSAVRHLCEAVATNPSASSYRRALDIAFAHNLIDLARKLTAEGRRRNPRDKRLRRWAVVLAHPEQPSRTIEIAAPDDREMNRKWLEDHAQRYRGRWVVLAGGRLLAAGRSLERALSAARRKSSATPLVQFIAA